LCPFYFIPIGGLMKVKNIYYGWWLLIALVIVGSIGPMTRYGVPALFPELSSDLGWSRSLIGTAQSVSLWVYSFISILTGLMIDRVGGRKTIFFGGIICLIGWILLSTMHSVWQLFLYYGCVMGIAISFTHLVCVQSVSRKWFVKRGGLAGGIVGSAFAIGTSVFSPLLTSLAADYGWRNVSMVAAFASGIPIMLLAFFVIRNTPESMGLHPDGVLLVESVKPIVKSDGRWNIRKALGTNQFWLLFFSYSLTGIVYNGILGHIVIWGTDLGSTAAAAGIFVTLFNGPSVAARIFGGMMGDRHGKHRILIIGTAMSLGVMILGFLGVSSSVLLAIFAVVIGIAAGFGNTLFAPYLGDLYGRENVGSLFGILTLGWGLIGGVGPLLWGWIYEWTGSYKVALLISAVCYAVALLVVCLVRPLKQPEPVRYILEATKPEK
jgi:MFS family permease